MFLLLLLAIVTTSALVCMEKNEFETFPYEKLLPELKKVIIKLVAQTSTLTEAVAHFKNLRTSNSQFNTQQALDIFFDALLEKFPNQEIRMAKLLKSPMTTTWLTNKRKAKGLPAYQEKSTTSTDVVSVQKAIYDGKVEEVKEWLEHGYNPNDILLLVIQHSPSEKALELLKLLVAYGANLNMQFISRRGSKTISLLYQVSRIKNINKSAQETKRYTDIINYLISEGAHFNQGEEKLLAQQSK